MAPPTIDLPVITNEKTAPTDPVVSQTPGILGVLAEALGLDSGEVRQVKDLSRATGIPVETILAMARKLAADTGVSIDMALQIIAQSQTQAWHQQATEEAARLGPSASGRADPFISDEFFKNIPGVRGTVDTFQALKSVEDERNAAMDKIREDVRKGLH